MKNRFYFKITLVLVAVCCVIISKNHAYLLRLPAGDTCQKGVDGAPDHVCRVFDNCSTIEKDIRQGTYPPICSFVGNDPVFCCSPDTNGTKMHVNSSYSAAEMCHRYSELAYNYVRIPSPAEIELTTLKPKYLKTLSCRNDDLLTQRIVGGKFAQAKEFPHMALLGYGGHGNEEKYWGCGGSLISDRWILSAAHCVFNLGQTVSWARLGNLNIKSDDTNVNSRYYRIIDHVVYPDYNQSYVYHDIALFRLETDVEFSEYIRPVCLNTNRSIRFTTASVIGWGRTKSNGPTSPDLLRADLRPITIQQCQDSYPPNLYPRVIQGIFDDSMLCAGDYVEGKDTCSGDSGGPMQIPHDKYPCIHTQIGITSFGKYCGSKNTPGIYTRVSNYIGWIEPIVWPKS